MTAFKTNSPAKAPQSPVARIGKAHAAQPTPTLPPAPHPSLVLPLLDHLSERNTTVPLYRTLTKALTTRRKHGSLGEARFFSWLVAETSAYSFDTPLIDAGGNLHVTITPEEGPVSRTLFTSHTDTCHRNTGLEVNAVFVDRSPAPGSTEPREVWRAGPGHCLGADDGAGVALMVHMIAAQVPGTYVFFRGEECGGVGSRWLVENMPEYLGAFDRAVAFDRAGQSDVITHQSGSRCCSDAFAAALAAALTPEDFSMAYSPDSTGAYTDTAEFTGIIPECTNISVGYRQQHGEMEHQDVGSLARLADQLLTIDWDVLPTVRDPKARSLFAGYGSMSTWTPRTAFTDPQPQRLTGDEADLENALDRAALTGRHGELKRLVAELAHPDNAETALQLMSRPLAEEDIEDAYDALTWGVDAPSVALDLFNACCTH